MKRTAAAGCALAAVAVGLTGCGGTAGSSGGGSGSAEGLSVGYSQPAGSQGAQGYISEGMKAASAELGWNLQEYDANLSSSTQVSDVQTMVGQQKAAIGLWPLDPGSLGGAFGQAKSSNIPVVVVNTPDSGADAVVWWETGLCGDDAPYVRAAKQIAQERPGGNVVVMGGPPVPSIQNNVKCFTDAAKAAGLNVLTEVDNTSDGTAGAATLAADVLTSYSDIDAIWAYNDSTALGASSAVIAAGRTVAKGSGEGIIIQGTNGDPEAIDAIKQGRLTGTWDPDSEATGFAVIRAMRDLVENGSSPDIVVKAVYVDSTNVDSHPAPGGRDYTLDDFPTVDDAEG